VQDIAGARLSPLKQFQCLGAAAHVARAPQKSTR
jgi:hypothetical protein